MGAMYMECSSKEMNGVHEIFETAIDIAVCSGDDELAKATGGVSRQGVPVKRKKRSNCKIL